MSETEKIKHRALTITRWIGSPASAVTHTLVFALSFLSVVFKWIEWDRMLLVLTTVVSLEAIYLAIFIQMTINYTTQEIEVVGQDIDEIQEDIEELHENVDILQEDVSEMSDEEVAEESRKQEQKKALGDIQTDLRRLLADVERLKQNQK